MKSSSCYNSRVRSGTMNLLDQILSLSSLSFLIVLCVFLFVRNVHQLFPLFAAYASVLLAGTVVVWLVYRRFGFGSWLPIMPIGDPYF